MDCKSVTYSGHAIQRIFERKIAEADITEVICSGDVIAEYPHDIPYPSYLLLGFLRNTPLHVLIGKDDENGNWYVVTTYVPSRDIWNDDYKTRRA
ncbi:MAG: DUF4258 domain-containing protein [Pseudomonadota bacterium]